MLLFFSHWACNFSHITSQKGFFTQPYALQDKHMTKYTILFIWPLGSGYMSHTPVQSLEQPVGDGHIIVLHVIIYDILSTRLCGLASVIVVYYR